MHLQKNSTLLMISDKLIPTVKVMPINTQYDINNRYRTDFKLGKNESDINNKNNSIYIGNNLSSKYKIDSAGSEWTMQFDYNYLRTIIHSIIIIYSLLAG